MYSTTTTNTTTTTTTTSTTPTNTTQLSHAQRTPSLFSYTPHPQSDHNAHIKAAIDGLIASMVNLPNRNEPDFSTLLKICGEFKNNAAHLEQAQHQASLKSELNLLRQQLPKLFKQIDRCLEIQIGSNTKLDLGSLETLCMGLSTLAPPLTGSLLTNTQREDCQAILTTISAKLAASLSDQFTHGYVDTGALLNCLNWFSRSLKADLTQKNQPAVRTLFDDVLHQMHAWSATRTQPTNLNNRQFCKCMVQLNTMLKQRSIDMDPDKASGLANRKIWAETVKNLCRHFVSEGQWHYDSQLVELINITNTLKDGLEQGLLSSSDTALTPVFNILAQRICTQEFDICHASSLAGLGNCANFLRTLFEHNLLGKTESATGKAVMHLVSELNLQPITSDLNSNSAQSLVNLASFVKATDRWLATQPKLASTGSHAALAQASSTLINALSVLAHNPNPSWMHSPQTYSALLAALQHLWQRGFVRAEQRDLLEPILIQLLQSIPNWKQGERNSRSTLLSLRALVAIADQYSPVAHLGSTPVFAKALTTLLAHLEQSKLVHYTNEERLASLQAIQIGAALDTIDLHTLQPLLQSLLQTKEAVDLKMIETAIRNFGGLVARLEPLSAEAIRLADAVINDASGKVNQIKQRGETYRGEVPQPTKRERLMEARPLSDKQDWIMVDKGLKPDLPIAEHQVHFPFTATPSTAPKLISRPSELNKGIKLKEKKTASPAAANSPQPVKSEKIKKTKQAAQGLNLQQAQSTWFDLLKDPQGMPLQRLQELASAYPQLLNMRAPGKQGQIALFYAITQGKKDIVEWLMKQEQHVLDQPLGEFLLAALNTIGLVEKRHVGGVRVLIDAYLRKFELQIRDALAEQMPGRQPLSKQEIINRKESLLSDAQKAELEKFAILKPLFEEYKLIASKKIVVASKEKQNHVVKIDSMTELIRLKIKFFESVRSNDWNEVKKKLKELEKISPGLSNTIVMMTAEGGWSPLMGAADLGYTDIVTLLLESVKDKDALLQIKSEKGLTALMCAVNSGHQQIVKILLDAASDKDALIRMKNDLGWTAMTMAAEAGHTEIVTLLLASVKDKEALLQIKNNNGWGALMLAIDNNHIETVLALSGEAGSKLALMGKAANKNVVADIKKTIDRAKQSVTDM